MTGVVVANVSDELSRHYFKGLGQEACKRWLLGGRKDLDVPELVGNQGKRYHWVRYSPLANNSRFLFFLHKRLRDNPHEKTALTN